MFGPFGKNNERRKAPRAIEDANAWIRLNEGVAVRPCNLIDLSDIGVRIRVDSAQIVRGEFTLLMSRDARTGRRARVKWRNASQIGAMFL
jgi:hypothetical protein